jgi:hypothetical protein
MNKNIVNSKLRKECSVQHSGHIDLHLIPHLKNQNYYIVDIPLDGDAPKQYIKAYFYYSNCAWKSKPGRWSGYYAKFGGKSYPHESVVEYGINQIGDSLGLKMNETKLVVVNGQIRFLSKDFIERGKTKLIHGVEILHEYFEDKDFVDKINEDRKQRRELLTFDEVESAFRHVHPNQSKELLIELVKLITFDAIVGNNDRHFYNWGVIGYVESKHLKKVEFAPIYDTARGLFWNDVEPKISEMYNRYVQGSKDQINAFLHRSKPRFSFAGNATSDHFELIEFLAKSNNDYRKAISTLVTKEAENQAIEKLKSSIFRYVSTKRLFLMTEILKLRFTTLRDKINGSTT